MGKTIMSDLYGDDDENKIDSEDLNVGVLSTMPLGLLLEELGRRSENYVYAFVDNRINEEGTILHFEVKEKFPGSMGQFIKSMYESSKELCDDYIVRSLQNGTRFSAIGSSSPEEEDFNNG